MTREADTKELAAGLYDGGWRSGDLDELIEHFGLGDEEAMDICDALLERCTELFAPVDRALARLETAYDARSDRPDAGEGDEVLKELNRICPGLLRCYRPWGSSWERIVRSCISTTVAEKVPASDVQRVVKELVGLIEYAEGLLEEDMEEGE